MARWRLECLILIADGPVGCTLPWLGMQKWKSWFSSRGGGLKRPGPPLTPNGSRDTFRNKVEKEFPDETCVNSHSARNLGFVGWALLGLGANFIPFRGLGWQPRGQQRRRHRGSF